MAFPTLSGAKGLLQSKTALVGLALAVIGLLTLFHVFPATLTSGFLGLVLLVGGVLVAVFRATAVKKVTGFLTASLT